jgi:bacterioferritin
MSDVSELIDGLNEDLAAEYQAVIMYRTYAALVSGPWRQELRGFFESEIPDELGHAAFLADKIVAPGRCWRTPSRPRSTPSSATPGASSRPRRSARSP